MTKKISFSCGTCMRLRTSRPAAGLVSQYKEKNLSLNFLCDGYDNNNDRFQINLKRNSVEDAGIGKAIYISGIGRYLNLKHKECTYAVNYLNSKVGFYKQICKD